MKRLLFALLFCSTPSWALFSGYTYQRTLVISSSNVSGVSGTDLFNFPVLISTISATLATTGNGGHLSNASGFDLIFSTVSDCSFKTNWDTETYNASMGNLIAWVKVPILDTTTITAATLYMCYGNSGITTYQGISSGTWDSSYKGVFHYPDGTTLGTNDSTVNAVTGTNTGSTATTGQVDGAISFASGNNVNYGNVSNYNFGTNDFTLSVWVKFASGASGYVVNKRLLCSDAPFWSISVGPNVELEVTTTGNAGSADSVGAIDNSLFHYISATRAGTALKLYVDGAANGTGTNAGGVANITTTGSMKVGIGAACAGNFVGQVDELRLSNGIARSPDWIKTEYNNQNSPNTFFTFGSESGGTVAPPVNHYGLNIRGGKTTIRGGRTVIK